MKISIAMATYNGEKYILEQLESFVMQTRQPDELMITDDCSTDGTVNILKNFQKNAPFTVKIYINDTNLGYTQNFNKALQLCSGDLVFLSDQDDVWFDEKLEYMVNLIKQHPTKSVFMCDTEFTNELLSPSGITKQMQIKRLRGKLNGFVTGCCIMVKKDFLDQILPIPKSFQGHDNWIVNIADALNQRYVDGQVLQYYRRHGSNESVDLSNEIQIIRIKDRLKLFLIRLKRKLFIGNWITYFQRKNMIVQKVKEINEKYKNNHSTF